MEETELDDELTLVAMQIILHAGDGRGFLRKAMEALEKFQFSQAWEYIGEAKKEIELAHDAQTTLIQSEAQGEKYEFRFIFTHAQDTLMTIMSEENLCETIIRITEAFYKEMNKN